jgi:hypothetical protein
MLHLGHPVLGDDQYGLEGWVLRGNGLFLQAQQVTCAHPTTGAPLDVQIPELPKFSAHRVREERRWAKWHAAPDSSCGEDRPEPTGLRSAHP